MSRLKDICFDSADPWALGNWWAGVLGYRVRPHTADDLATLKARGITDAEKKSTNCSNAARRSSCTTNDGP